MAPTTGIESYFDLCKVYESVCLAGEVPRGQRGRGNPLPPQFTRRVVLRSASAHASARRTSTHPRPAAKSNSNIGEPHAQRATRGTSSSESQTPTTIPLRYHLKILTRARRPPSGHLRARGISARADQRSLERRITHAGSSEIEIEPLPIGNGIEIEISPSGITHNPKTQSITVDL